MKRKGRTITKLRVGTTIQLHADKGNTGHVFKPDVNIQFVNAEDQVLFEVCVDGPHSISVRGINTVFQDKKFFGAQLAIHPMAGNTIIVTNREMPS